MTVHVRLICWPALPVIGDGGSTINGGILVVTGYKEKINIKCNPVHM